MFRLAGTAAGAALLATACTFGGSSGDGDDLDAATETPVFPSGHRFRKAIEIEPTIDDGAISGFMLAVFTPADAEIAAGALADGSDLMVTEADNNEPLPFELESFDPSTGAFSLWLERTPLKRETLYLYYGLDVGAPRPSLEWPLDFRAVWHGGVDSDIARDSSRSGLDATRSAGGPLALTTAGAIGVGIDMEAASARFETSDAAIRFRFDSFTYSTWVMVEAPSGLGDQPWHYGGNNATVPGYDMELGSGTWQASVSGGGELRSADFGQLSDFEGAWTHLVAVVDRGANTFRTYANGALTESRAITAGIDLEPAVSMVARLGGESAFVGILDEVRVNASAHGPTRIKAQYDNVADPSFVSVGGQELP